MARPSFLLILLAALAVAHVEVRAEPTPPVDVTSVPSVLALLRSLPVRRPLTDRLEFERRADEPCVSESQWSCRTSLRYRRRRLPRSDLARMRTEASDLCTAGDGLACGLLCEILSTHLPSPGSAEDRERVQVCDSACSLRDAVACEIRAQLCLGDPLSLSEAPYRVCPSGERLLERSCTAGGGDACQQLGNDVPFASRLSRERRLELLTDSCAVGLALGCADLSRQVAGGPSSPGDTPNAPLSSDQLMLRACALGSQRACADSCTRGTRDGNDSAATDAACSRACSRSDGEYCLVRATYDLAVAPDGDDPRAKRAIAYLQANCGDYPEACRALADLYEQGRFVRRDPRRARTYRSRGDRAEEQQMNDGSLGE